MTPMRATAKRGTGWRKRQRGATALEFALVFPIFLALFYATLNFGLISLAKLNLQFAAEIGARDALRWQQTAGEPEDPVGCTENTDPTGAAPQLAMRVERARRSSCTQSAWLLRWGEPEVSAVVCLISDTTCAESPPDEAPACGRDAADLCQMVVTIRYPYATRPMIPTLPGFGILAPASIQGQARVILDGRGL